jgi:hypothetical protein
MRSANLFLIAVVLCGGSLLLSCKKHEPSANNQPKADQMTAAPSASPTPAATPQTASSPELVKAAAPEVKAAAASAKPTPAAPSSVVLLPDKDAGANTGNLDHFAKCLTQKQLTMYGHYLCPHCAEQKEKFAESFQYIHYVECGVFGQPMTIQNQTCKDMQIKRYPTWVFADGERVEAVETMQQLSQKTGCKLP